MVEAAGIEPVEVKSANTTSEQHATTKPLQNNTLATAPTSGDSQGATPSTQDNNTFQQPKCVPAVYENLPEDLAKIVAAWPHLTDDLKRKIVDML